MTHLVQAYDAAGLSLDRDHITHAERLHVERARHELGLAMASAEARRSARVREGLGGGARPALDPDTEAGVLWTEREQQWAAPVEGSSER